MEFRTRHGHRLPDTECPVDDAGRVSRPGRNWLHMLAMIACVAAATVAGWAFATNYVYDANGRLAVVTNDAGQSARYLYDELGNLTGVQRLGAGDLAVFGFNPSRGAPGVQVTVQGHGFSATAADNAVTFNGAPALVSVATANELVATVPAGAATGPIAVSVGANTAASATSFVVDEDLRPPTITSVAPLIGAIGTAITVTGDSLAPISNQTDVRLNHRPAHPSAVTNVEVVFPIPSQTGSGKVRISTPYGTAASAQDVVVVPTGVDPAKVVQSKRLVLDAPAQGFAVAETGESAAALFDGVSGEYVTAVFTDISVANIAYSLYGVHNNLIASGTATAASPAVLLPQLKATGTYLLLMTPSAGPATWTVALARDKSVLVDGEAEAASTLAGRQQRLAFAASAGQQLGLGISDLVVNTGSYMHVAVYEPDGSALTNSTQCYGSQGGCGLNVSIATTGVHSVIVTPRNASQMMSFQTTLSSDVTGILVPDVPRTVTLERRGQNGRLSFAGAAGETVGLQVAGQATVPANRSVYYYVYKPDGTLLTSSDTNSAATLNLANLPATGTYTVLVDPRYGETLTAQLKLSSGTTGGEEIDGVGGEYETAVPGEYTYMTFAATEGGRLGLGISDLTVNTGAHVYVRVYKPDGSALMSSTTCYVAQGGCGLNLSITTTGVHSVIVAPQSASQMMSFQTTLSSDAMGTLVRDVAQTLALPRRGQNGRLSFTAIAGETVGLQVAGQTTVPANRGVYYYVYKPDGTLLTSTNTTSAITLNLTSLPATGTYTVFVDSFYGEALTAQLTLSSGTTGGEEIDGAGGEYETTVPGQNVYVTFAASGGQRLGLGVSDLTVNTGSYINVSAYKPDGGVLVSTTCYMSDDGCDLNLSIATTGTYSIVFTPRNSSQTMSFQTTLSADVEGTLAGGITHTLELARRGQNGLLTFPGTAGETLMLLVENHATVPANRSVSYYVYKPDGTLLTAMGVDTITALDLANLPTTGNYTVFVDPRSGASATMDLTLLPGLVDSLEIDGAAEEPVTAYPGQHVYLTFSGVAGQRLGLGISELATSYSDRVMVYVYKPDGTQLTSVSCQVFYDGCGLNLWTVSTGTYTVAVKAIHTSQTMSFKATLSADVSGVLERDVPLNLDLPQRGQNGRMVFTATAGETLALQAAGQITVPANRDTYYWIYRPDGGLLASMTTRDVATKNLPNLPVTGDYTVLADPGYGEVLAVQLTLATGTTGGAEVDGAVGNYATTMPGESAYLTFSATAGQRLGLGISDLVMSIGGGSSANVYVYRPDGSQLTSKQCPMIQEGCGLDLAIASTGVYSAVVSPYVKTITMQFKATLSTDVAGTLARDVAQTLALPRHGQNGRLTFVGTGGETVGLQVAGQATVPANRSVYYYVYKPDGTLLTSTNTTSASTLNLANLPVTGTYTVFVDPFYGESLQAQVTLSTP